MIYLVAIICPPLALLFKGKIFQAIFNGALWVVGLIFLILFGWVLWGLTVLWAIIVIKGVNEQERHDEIVDAIKSRD